MQLAINKLVPNADTPPISPNRGTPQMRFSYKDMSSVRPNTEPHALPLHGEPPTRNPPARVPTRSPVPERQQQQTHAPCYTPEPDTDLPTDLRLPTGDKSRNLLSKHSASVSAPPRPTSAANPALGRWEDGGRRGSAPVVPASRDLAHGRPSMT